MSEKATIGGMKNWGEVEKAVRKMKRDIAHKEGVKVKDITFYTSVSQNHIIVAPWTIQKGKNEKEEIS